MNNIEVNPFGAAEHCAIDNWAAEYAKKLFIAEAAQRTEDITSEAQARVLEDSKIRGEYAAADSKLRSELTAADNALEQKKVNRDEYATETTPGIVTLHRGSANNSGLLVGTKGELAVNVSADGRYGLTRDGAGQIKTYAASEAEIAAGTDQYKPIVPSTVKGAVENITGKVSELKIGMIMPDGTTQYAPSTSFTAAVNTVSGQITDIRKMLTDGKTYVSCIDNDSLLKVAQGNGMVANTKTTVPEGIYLWVPDTWYRSINGLEYVDSNNEGMFKPDKLCIIQLGTTKRVLYSQYEEERKQTYSTTPVRIGTWIDGTPVWRAGIPMTPVESIGCANPEAAWHTDAISILYELDIIADSSKVVYIDSSLMFQNDSDYQHDSFATNSTEFFPGRYRFTATDVDWATHVYGWIEFVTPESNIA